MKPNASQYPNRRYHILLVEDDPAIALGLQDTLEFEGYTVTHAPTGGEATTFLEDKGGTRPADLVILDVMLADTHGFQLCESIRMRFPSIPIMMLTARSQESDKVRGLNAGADDYLTKPFSVAELIARVAALLRRTNTHARTPIAGTFKIGELSVDPVSQQITNKRGEKTMLSYYEVEVLRLLMDHHLNHHGEPVHRDVILKTVWCVEPTPNNRTVDNLILKLRKKIEPDPDTPIHLLSVYGVGYKLVP